MEGKARSKQTASNITLDDQSHRSNKYNLASIESNRGVKCRIGVVSDCRCARACPVVNAANTGKGKHAEREGQQQSRGQHSERQEVWKKIKA